MIRKFDDQTLYPGHHSIRLQGYDYSSTGPFFVTICTHEKRCIFDRIVEACVELNRMGRVVRECWNSVPVHFPQVSLHEFAIMPNHVHGIVEIGSQVGAQHAAPLPRPRSKTDSGLKAGSLGAVVRSFKAAVAKQAREELGWHGPVWQRNYFERVVRNGQEFADASRYIAENPARWEWDRENPQMKLVRLRGE